MTYLLDANAAIAIINGRPASVRKHLRESLAQAARIIISSIVLAELWYGVARSERHVENGDRLRIFLSGEIAVAPFEAEDAVVSGSLRAALRAVGSPVGPYDLLIGAQALRLGATLVTANASEFSRVPNLAWEDWS